MQSQWVAWILGALVCLASFEARAEEDESWSRLASSRFEIQTARLLTGTDSLAFLPLTLTGQQRVSEHVVLDLTGALLALIPSRVTLGASPTASAEWGVIPGNITAGARRVARIGSDAMLSYGVALSSQVNQSNADERRTVLRFAVFRSLGVNIQDFIPSTTFVRFPLGVEVHMGSVGVFASSLTPMLWFSKVGPETFSVEHSDEVRIQVHESFVAGLKLNAVVLGGDENGREASTMVLFSVSPFIGIEPSEPGFTARVALLVPLKGDSSSGRTSEWDNVILTLQSGVVF